MKEETRLKRRKRAIDNAFKKARNMRYDCFFSGCHEKAIGSHSQSTSLSLKSIQENGFVVTKDFHAFQQNALPKWKQLGLKKASTFPGFCSIHDSELFKEVDSICDDNISAKTLAWLAFRTFAMEMRKKEYETNKIESFIEIAKKDYVLEPSDLENCPTDGFQNCLNVTKPFYLSFFESLLTLTEPPQMAHKIFRLELNVGVSCSTFINPVPLLNQLIDKPQPFISFNILPRQNYTLIIFSCAIKDKAIMSNFINCNRRLEDLIFNYCEEVTLNPTFFSTINSSTIEIIDQALSPWDVWTEEKIPDLFNVKLDDRFILNLINKKIG